MKKYFIGGLLPFLILFGLSYSLIKAADVEVILGTSSGFKIVRGASVSAGTSTFFVGSSTVGIGTTTQDAAMLFIVGSSTSSSDSALKVGTATLWVGNNASVGIGTTTPATVLHVIGTITTASNLKTGGTVTIGSVPMSEGTTGTLYITGTTTASDLKAVGTFSIGSIAMSEGTAGTVTYRGNLRVLGNFAATTKALLIPHTDPEKRGWLLRHSTVEAPTRGDNLYRFKIDIQLDGGEIDISLPSYWKHLNEDPQVWVTAIGQFANGYGYVDETSGKLVIKGEKRGGYNVLLVGTRKDRLAKDFFDAQGVEFVDKEMYELFTQGGKHDEKHLIQLMNANNAVNSKFVDPIGDELGLATCQ